MHESGGECRSHDVQPSPVNFLGQLCQSFPRPGWSRMGGSVQSAPCIASPCAYRACAQRRPNLRSSEAPTARHQARFARTRYIFANPGLASCSRRPLSSKVSSKFTHTAHCLLPKEENLEIPYLRRFHSRRTDTYRNPHRNRKSQKTVSA